MNVYWLVVAGGFVLALLVTAGALVISAAGLLLLIMSLVAGAPALFRLVLLKLAGGSLDIELVEFGWFIDLFPHPTRNSAATIGMIVFIILLELNFLINGNRPLPSVFIVCL